MDERRRTEGEGRGVDASPGDVGDDDCDGVGDSPDCLGTPLPAPGCAASCSAGRGRGSWLGLLLLVFVRRRRR